MAVERYLVVLDADTPATDGTGQPIILPAGTVVNEILLDPGSQYMPPDGTHLVKAS